MVRGFEQSGSALFDMAQRTNKSVEVLQELGYAAEQTGTSMAVIEKAINKARSEGKNFEEMAAQIASIQDPALQSQKAIELFGVRLGAQLVPMLRDLPELQKQFRELGLGMSGRDAAAADDLGDSFLDLRLVIKSARDAIGSALAPTVTTATKAITRIALTIRDWVKENRELFVSALKIGVVVMGVGAVITAIGTGMVIAGASIAAFSTLLGVAATVISAIVSPIGLVVAGLIGLSTWFATSTEWGRQFVQTLMGYFGTLLDTAKETFGGIADALAAGDLALAAKVAWAGIQLEWLQGTNWIREKWADFKDFYLRTTTEVVYKAMELWTNLSSYAVGIWTKMETKSRSIGESIGHWLTRSSDPDLRRDQDAAHEVALKQIEEEGKARINAVAIGRDNSLAEIDAAREAAQGTRDTAFNKETADREKALADAKSELAALKEKAAVKRKEKELGKGPEFKPGAFNLGSGAVEAKVFGSFSAASLTAGGGGGTQQKLLDETKEARMERRRQHRETMAVLRGTNRTRA
jgi:hypothetical protein